MSSCASGWRWCSSVHYRVLHLKIKLMLCLLAAEKRKSPPPTPTPHVTDVIRNPNSAELLRLWFCSFTLILQTSWLDAESRSWVTFHCFSTLRLYLSLSRDLHRLSDLVLQFANPRPLLRMYFNPQVVCSNRISSFLSPSYFPCSASSPSLPVVEV